MLTGRFPFVANQREQTFYNIKNKVINFSQPYWATVSDSAKDLILKMVEKDPKERIKLGEVLRHPWIASANISVPRQ